VPQGSFTDRLGALVEPVLAGAGFELYDLERAGQVLRVAVDRPGGIDLDAVGEASRLVSSVLDAHDDALGPLAAGRYVLEVTSPGVERRLRTPDHFRRFVGTTVAVKTAPGAPGPRRLEGVLEAADDDGIVVDGRHLSHAEVARARTTFDWSSPSPGGRPRQAQVGP